MLFNGSARLGARLHQGMVYHNGRRPMPRILPSHPLASDDQREFKVCSLTNKNMTTLGLAMAITTMLIVMSSYGKEEMSSWFYSVAVLMAGILVLVIGPILVCRFLFRSYIQSQVSQVVAASANRDTQVETMDGASEAVASSSGGPQLYACIVITPAMEAVRREAARIPLPPIETPPPDLPTYEEALEARGKWEAAPPEYDSLSLSAELAPPPLYASNPRLDSPPPSQPPSPPPSPPTPPPPSETTPAEEHPPSPSDVVLSLPPTPQTSLHTSDP